MSTDLHNRTRPPSDEGPERHEPPKSSLSIAQVVGGALAAMTAAFLGSRLSVAGTVVGAALASIIAAVGGALYTASLRRTSRHVGAVLAKVRPTASGGTGTADRTPAPPTLEPQLVTRSAPGWVLPTEPASGTASRGPSARRSRIGWKPVLVGALLMFVVAALALTGIELATGRALSGGTGTTVGRVADAGAPASPTPTHRATPKPSATPTATPSAEPSTTASSTPSSEPTAEPSTTPTAAPSATPTPSSAPSSTPAAPRAPSGATPAS